MSIIKKRRGESTSSQTTLTPKMFLGKEGKEPYIDPKTLLTFIDNSRIEDVDEMEAFFMLVKENLKMSVNRKIKTDIKGNRYKFETFFRAKGSEGVKVMLIGDIQRFISDYQAGKFEIDFTLEDLVSEAEVA
jgi:hypothetical protein